MNCPKCNAALSMTDRQGVEIDFCPQCRGVWLDRGVLDKIIERSGAFTAPPAMSVAAGTPPPIPPPQAPPPNRRRDDDDDDDDDYRYRQQQHYAGQPHVAQYPPKKKKSFLGDLFDF